jgi:hypothetical protein
MTVFVQLCQVCDDRSRRNLSELLVTLALRQENS